MTARRLSQEKSSPGLKMQATSNTPPGEKVLHELEPFNDPRTPIWRYTSAIEKQGNRLSTSHNDNALNRTATFGE